MSKGPFLSFLDYYEIMYEFQTGNALVLGDHDAEIAEALTKVFALQTRNLFIQMPPGYRKTTTLLYFLTWAHGFWPESRSIACSKAKEFTVEKYTLAAMQIMSNELYKEMFPHCVINKSARARQDIFDTTLGGWIYAVGAEGDIGGRRIGTGRKGVFQGTWIFDDLIELDDGMYSKTRRDKVNRWHDSTIYTRRSLTESDPNIYIAQRLHVDDVIGHVMGNLRDDDYLAVKIKALDANNKSTFGFMYQTDDLLNLQEKRPVMFAAQFMQEPIKGGGTLIDTTDFFRFDRTPDFDKTVLSIDTALKDINDPWGFSLYGESGEQVHILDAFQKHVDYHGGLSLVAEYCLNKRPDTVLIEDKTLGYQLIKDLKAGPDAWKSVKYRPNIIAITSKNTPLTRDKVARMSVANDTIKSGIVGIPEQGAWVGFFLNICEAFPDTDDDHIIDTLSQYLNWRKDGASKIINAVSRGIAVSGAPSRANIRSTKRRMRMQ